jgi:hypothetical protein
MRLSNHCHTFKQSAPKRALVVCMSLCLVVPAWALEPASADLDTLFYTPAQRANIIGQRQGQSGESLFGTKQQLTGVVRRGNGKSTVWINGKAQQEGQPKTPPLQGLDALVDGKRLRVGESVDSITGARADVVAPGTVTVKGGK